MRQLVLALVLALMTSACATFPSFDSESDGVSGPYTGAIPSRPAKAMTGSEFLKYVERMGQTQREEAILTEIRRGNMPNFLRQLQPIRLSTTQAGKTVKGTVWVMPNYLAIGSNDDYAFMPMSPITAQKIADHFGMLLPTRKLVDTVYQQAQIKLTPAPLKASVEMASTAYYRQHNQMLQEQIRGRNQKAVTAGHKKDVVLTNQLCRVKRRVAIYGWHTPQGKAIQPLSTVHGDSYADYSHGIRLVANTMQVDGVERPVEEVLTNPQLAGLISDEGTVKMWRIATDCTVCGG